MMYLHFSKDASIEVLHFVVYKSVKLLCHHLFMTSTLLALKNFKKRKCLLIAPSVFNARSYLLAEGEEKNRSYIQKTLPGAQTHDNGKYQQKLK